MAFIGGASYLIMRMSPIGSLILLSLAIGLDVWSLMRKIKYADSDMPYGVPLLSWFVYLPFSLVWWHEWIIRVGSLAALTIFHIACQLLLPAVILGWIRRGKNSI
jgi:hypothetical protein